MTASSIEDIIKMIRTENITNDCIYTTSKKTYLVSLLPAWLLNDKHKVNQNCTINDLSTSGAALLIPRNRTTLAESFDLVFMSPDNEDETLTVLPAELRWRDEDNFPDHIKIGVEFSEMNPIKTQMINAMIEILILKKNFAAQCIPPALPNVQNSGCIILGV
jgi:hypothetical protein